MATTWSGAGWSPASPWQCGAVYPQMINPTRTGATMKFPINHRRSIDKENRSSDRSGQMVRSGNKGIVAGSDRIRSGSSSDRSVEIEPRMGLPRGLWDRRGESAWSYGTLMGPSRRVRLRSFSGCVSIPPVRSVVHPGGRVFTPGERCGVESLGRGWRLPCCSATLRRPAI